MSKEVQNKIIFVDGSSKTEEVLMFRWILCLKQKLSLRTRWHKFRRLSSVVGTRVALEFLWNRRFRHRGEFQIHPLGVKYPLTLRAGTSDLNVFYQIFVQHEYGDLDDMTDVRLVIDCGAYIGLSAAYFLSRFPECRLMAIEPNLENFMMLKKNLMPYGDRVKLFHAGIWSHKTKLKMAESVYRDGQHWSGQVRPCSGGEIDGFQALDISGLLENSGQERISILKMDIEGAEAVVFAQGDRSWLNKTDAIAIELHDDSSFGPASDIFFTVIAPQNFQISQSGELTICRRENPVS